MRATGRRALGRMKQTVTRMQNAPAAVKGGAEGRPKQTLHVLPGSPSRQSRAHNVWQGPVHDKCSVRLPRGYGDGESFPVPRTLATTSTHPRGVTCAFNDPRRHLATPLHLYRCEMTGQGEGRRVRLSANRPWASDMGKSPAATKLNRGGGRRPPPAPTPVARPRRAIRTAHIQTFARWMPFSGCPGSGGV